MRSLDPPHGGIGRQGDKDDVVIGGIFRLGHNDARLDGRMQDGGAVVPVGGIPRARKRLSGGPADQPQPRDHDLHTSLLRPLMHCAILQCTEAATHGMTAPQAF